MTGVSFFGPMPSVARSINRYPAAAQEGHAASAHQANIVQGP